MFGKRFTEGVLVIAGSIGGANNGYGEELNPYETVTTRSLCEKLGEKARIASDGNRCELLGEKTVSKQSSEFAAKAMAATKTFIQGRKGYTVECTIPSPEKPALCKLSTNPPNGLNTSQCEAAVTLENNALASVTAVCKY